MQIENVLNGMKSSLICLSVDKIAYKLHSRKFILCFVSFLMGYIFYEFTQNYNFF